MEKETNATTPAKRSGLSVAGFICSLFGFITCGITSIIGLILSIIGLNDSKKKGQTDGLAIAGIVISAIPIVLFVLIIFIVATGNDVEVADFSNMTKEEAQKWCDDNDANCTITEEYSDTVAENMFIDQEKEAGTTVKSYEIIRIKYSKGKAPEGTKTNNEKENTKQPTKSAEEIKSEYISACESINYKDIARQPDSYKGKKAKFRGKVLQVKEGTFDSNKITLLVNVTEGEYGLWDDTVLVTYKYKEGENKILDDDIINMYGTIEGTESYVSVLGAKITIPSMTAKYIDIEQ